MERLPSDLRALIVEGKDAPLSPDGTIDRSRTDYRIARRLYDLNFTPGQVLTVLTHPQWFSGQKGRERDGIWPYAETTALRAFEDHREGKNTETLAEVVRELCTDAKGKVHKHIIAPDEQVKFKVISWLAKSGARFVKDPDLGRAFLVWEGKAIPAERGNRELKTFIYKQANLIGESQDHKMLCSLIEDHAHAEGEERKVTQWIDFDPVDLVLRVLPDKKLNRVVRVAENGVEVIVNGSDEYFLMPSYLMTKPIDISALTERDVIKLGLEKMVQLTTNNFPCDPVLRAFVTCWFWSITMRSVVQSDLLTSLNLVGEVASGKTTVLKILTKLMYGRDNPIEPTPASSYYISIYDPFIPFDDVENTTAWAERLLRSATGATRTKMDSAAENVVEQQSTVCWGITGTVPPELEALVRRMFRVETSSRFWSSDQFNELACLRKIEQERGLIWCAFLRLAAEEIIPKMRRGSAAKNIEAAKQVLAVSRNKPFASQLTLMWLIGTAIEKYVPGFLGLSDLSLENVIGSWVSLEAVPALQAYAELDPIVDAVQLLFDYLDSEMQYLAVKTSSKGYLTKRDLAGLSQFVTVRKVWLDKNGRVSAVEAPTAGFLAAFQKLCRSTGKDFGIENAYRLGHKLRASRDVLKSAGFVAEYLGLKEHAACWKFTREGAE